MPVGPVAANSYLLLVGDDAVVIDPGDEGPAIARQLVQRNKTLRAVWLTHAHFDHVGGITALLRAAGSVPVHMHPHDRPLLENAVNSAGRWNIQIEPPPTGTVDIVHGQLLTLGGLEATALHTPGHAPGHIAFYLADEGIVFSGDALFKGSVGRTDFPYANERQLLDSIRRELLSLPDDTQVLPGHGSPTTIGSERFGNPFL